VVEDSIVRGTTTRQIVKLLKENGAKEVHVRVASPPYKYPCFYGIDTAAADQLIAHKYSIKEICQQIEADSLAYLSIEGMIKAVGLPKENFCMACFDGNYPIKIPDETRAQKYIFEK
jgi:amidophosphoribosyltransferase